MWATESGERVLQGAERRVFVKAVGLLANWLDEFDKTDTRLETGAHLFDSLAIEQKFAMLDLVASALLRADVPAPTLTAVREATIGAVYRYLIALIEIEIDNSEVELRPLILAAVRERAEAQEFRFDESEDGGGTLPEETSASRDEWAELVELLSMEVLWDTDWDLPPGVLDMPPEQKRKWSKDYMIDRDYFTDVALDPSPADLTAVKRRLSHLADSEP
jgi:hypothetical protein